MNESDFKRLCVNTGVRCRTKQLAEQYIHMCLALGYHFVCVSPMDNTISPIPYEVWGSQTVYYVTEDNSLSISGILVTNYDYAINNNIEVVDFRGVKLTRELFIKEFEDKCISFYTQEALVKFLNLCYIFNIKWKSGDVAITPSVYPKYMPNEYLSISKLYDDVLIFGEKSWLNEDNELIEFGEHFLNSKIFDYYIKLYYASINKYINKLLIFNSNKDYLLFLDLLYNFNIKSSDSRAIESIINSYAGSENFSIKMRRNEDVLTYSCGTFTAQGIIESIVFNPDDLVGIMND